MLHQKRATRPLPQILVELEPGKTARATLRDRAGQLYLQWREGRFVRSVYVGLAAARSRSRAGCHAAKPRSDLERVEERYGLKTFPPPKGT